MEIRILAVGDVYGADGLAFAVRELRGIKNRTKTDLVIVNAENSATGNGTTPDTARQLLDAGADALTGGNHSLRHEKFFAMLEESVLCIHRAEEASLTPSLFVKSSATGT